MKDEKYYSDAGRDERLRSELIALFRGFGYGRYRMAKFESYDVYLKNKDYIDGGSIITFTDSKGRLLALRPDVTLSIVNNLPDDGVQKKYYYDESVFRRDKRGEYIELRQLGAEYIGGEGMYPECEAVLLAVKSLCFINSDCVLSIGHMDAVETCLSETGLSPADYSRAREYIGAKSMHELKKLLAGCDRAAADKLLALAGIEGPVPQAAAEAERLCGGSSKAIAELKTLVGALEANGVADKVRLDFSLIDDARYYNGVVFRGYVKGSASAVIYGGRYDNMLRRMGKSARAVGFAVDMTAASGRAEEDSVCDAVIVGGSVPPGSLFAEADRQAAAGRKVIAVERDVTGLDGVRRVFLEDEKEC